MEPKEEQPHPTLSRRKNLRWSKPTFGVDGSKLPTGEASTGYVILDHQGRVISTSASLCGFVSTLMVEAPALNSLRTVSG